MKKGTFFLILCIACLCLSAGCEETCKEAARNIVDPTSRDIPEAEDVLLRFYEAIDTGDYETAADLVAKDVNANTWYQLSDERKRALIPSEQMKKRFISELTVKYGTDGVNLIFTIKDMNSAQIYNYTDGADVLCTWENDGKTYSYRNWLYQIDGEWKIAHAIWPLKLKESGKVAFDGIDAYL